MDPIALSKAADARLAEFFDDFVLVGFPAGSGEPILVQRLRDARAAMALQYVIEGLDLTNGPPPSDAEKSV